MIGLTPPTAAKVRQLIDRSKGAGASLPSTGKGYGRVPVLVRCTSAAAADASGVGAQCYPGVIVDPLADRTVQPELGAVWLTLLDDGGAAAVPAINRVYECLLAGSVAVGTDTRPRAFGVGRYTPPPLGWSYVSPQGVGVTADSVPVSLASITIPEAGTYLIGANVRANIIANFPVNSTATAFMSADIAGVSGAVYQNFLCSAVCSAGPGDSGSNVFGSGVIVGIDSFAGPTTVTLRGWRTATGGLTWVVSKFLFTGNDFNTIWYLKLTGTVP